MTFSSVGTTVAIDDVCEHMDARTQALYRACQQHPHYDILELQRTGTGGDIAIVVDVGDGSVAPANPAGLWRRERLALYYRAGDDRLDVRALRVDFPDVVHLNAVAEGEPKSLCLFQLDNDTVARRYSASQLLNRILDWLEATAEERLHQDDQALEAIFYATNTLIILPADISERPSGSVEQLCAVASETIGDRQVIELRFFVPGSQPTAVGLCPVLVRVPPAGQGAIQRQPHRLADLDDALTMLGSSLLEPLREAVRAAAVSGSLPSTAVGNVKVLLIIEVPRVRDGLSLERFDHAGYLLDVDPATLGVALGVLYRAEGSATAFAVPLVGGDYAVEKTDAWRPIALCAVDVRRHLTPALARRLVGTEDAWADFRGVLAGVGALGSALADFWARSSWGRWHYIDPDRLEPHNVVRHLGRHPHVGAGKARLVRALTDAVYGTSDPSLKTLHGHAERVDDPEIRTVLDDVQLLVDASTTLAVPREWSTADSLARVASAFLTPSGRGSALLLEDSQRTVRADALEAQYYRALITQPWGADQLASVQALRSGAGCRDRTVIMAPDQIQLHAALISRRLQAKVRSPSASIQVWCADDDGGTVKLHEVEVAPVHRACAAGWTIVWDDGLLIDMAALRLGRLPSETGGVLFGTTDQKTRTIHLVFASDEPPGSIGSPTGFVRAAHGVEALREHVQLRTGLMVDYVGEWHSHPPGVGARASSDDVALIHSLAQRLNADGLPAVMVIAGEGEFGIYLRQDGIDVRAVRPASTTQQVLA